jgi:coenzyme F420-reducing hydrogenase delta subunit
MTDADFDPLLVVYCCRHCAYAAADLAGGMRIQYPPSVRIVEVPCSGRVDAVEMLHTFERGADGVIVAG